MSSSTRLRALLRPRSVAVVGAGASGLGRLVLDHVVTAGYRGRLWVVHPRLARVGAVRAVRSVAELPEPPELAVVALRRRDAIEAVRSLASVGCGAAVVVSAGFSEAGPAGAAAEADLLEAARAGGMRLLGPNCMGLVNNSRGARLHASFGVGPVPAGPLALVTGSGSVGDYVLYHAASHGLGISLLASVGNECDVSMDELVLAAGAERQTRVLAVYLEEPAAPSALLEALGRVARRKPVVVLRGGRTAVGASAASSHTGRLARGGGEAVDALIRATGALLISGLEELLATARALASRPAGAGPRLAIVTNAGGPGVLAADALAGAGLHAVRPPAAARRRLARALPTAPPSGGPVLDLTASAGPEAFEVAARALDGSADALLGLVMSPEGTDPGPTVTALARGWPDDPLLLCLLARGPAVESARALASKLGVPVTAEPTLAVCVAGVLAARAADLARAREPRPRPLDGRAVARARAIVERAAAEGRSVLGLPEALALAEACGIPLAPHRVASTPEGAVEAAERLGEPVYLKLDLPGLVHRTEARAVLGPFEDRAAVRRAARALLGQRARGRRGEPGRLVVQTALRGGVELLLGSTRVPGWGTVTVAGRGGVTAEVDPDVRFVASPTSPGALERAFRSTRSASVLGPFRGEPAVDLEPALRAGVTLSRVASALPILYELELSPFVAARGGAPCGAVDVRAVLEPAGRRPDAADGRMRRRTR